VIERVNNNNKGVSLMNYTNIFRVESKEKNLFGKTGLVYSAYDRDDKKVPAKFIPTELRKEAFESSSAIAVHEGGLKLVPISEFTTATIVDVDNSVDNSVTIDVPSEHTEVMSFIHNSYSLKPKGLMMSELKWKYLIRSGVRGKNIMMTGPAGCGKTMAAKSLVNSLDRADYYFNLGATQDPRSTLVGNTHFDKDKGTFFSRSLFVEAIQTPNSVILLDELSRAHPDAWNILMTVLDYGQRYLRLDEADGSDTIKVADGVTFVATANIGNEYTSTRVMDKALMDRFTIVEMDVLNESEESELLNYMFPNVDTQELNNVAKIATLTRTESSSDTARITSGISTRTTVELCGLLYDGFSLQEASEVSIYPQYDATGGVDSERTFVKQIVQKFCDDGSSEDLFNEDEMSEATMDN
jgi:nitric oxide reductase NorQ protein